MIKIYPAIFHKEDSYWVEFPDLKGCVSEGKTLEECMENAQEAMGLYLVALSEDNLDIPDASDIKTIKSKDIVSYVCTDISKYRRKKKAIRKTLSIPEWLAEEAEKRNISLSKVLQESLISKLGF